MTEIAKSTTATLRTLLEERKDALAQLVPKHLNAERLMKVALNCVAKTPKLQECTPASLLQCVITAAEIGLEPGGALGHAYLVPFKQSCTLIIGYRGFIELMRRSKELSSIRAVVVRQKDYFKLREGIEQTIDHEPNLDGDAGPLRYVYAVAKLKDGGTQVEFMTKNQIDAIRARSRSKDNGPWVTDYEEMAKKTVIRRIAKFLPMSSEMLERAEAADNDDFVDAEPVPDSVDRSVVEQAATAAVKERVRRLAIADVPEAPVLEPAADPSTFE